MLRLFKMNSVLLKYNNVYKYLVLYKLLLLSQSQNQNTNPFFDEDYIIVEETIKINLKEINDKKIEDEKIIDEKIKDKKIEDEWTEINFQDYLK